MANYDVVKIQELNQAVTDLRDRIYDELVAMFPGPAANRNWTKEQVKVTILPDQPKFGLKVRIEYPRTVPSRTRLPETLSSREVTIYPNGETTFPPMIIR